MAMVIAYDDAKASQRIEKNRYNEANIVQTPMLGRRGISDLPVVLLNVYGPGRLSTPHFHSVDQFQIMIDGKGKLGRRDIAPRSVHYSNAYTPYGPFVSDAQAGLTCLIIRARPDTGSQHTPEAFASLAKIPDRNPWQVTHDVTFPAADARSVQLDAVPEIQNDNGLAVYTLRMQPDAAAYTPDPSSGNGLFVVALKGSLVHAGRQSKALALVYLSDRDQKFEIRAGAEGLEGLIVQFPSSHAKTAHPARDLPSLPSERGSAWHCTLCSFVYDEGEGLPEEGIAPGTRWDDIPADWTCPDCTAGKIEFQPAKS